MDRGAKRNNYNWEIERGRYGQIKLNTDNRINELNRNKSLLHTKLEIQKNERHLIVKNKSEIDMGKYINKIQYKNKVAFNQYGKNLTKYAKKHSSK